jgi:hypothetical protein
MNIKMTFSIPNPDYDQEYADDYHNGEESENNTRQNWAKGYAVEDVVKIIEERNSDFQLKGSLVNSNENFNFLIQNLRIIRFISSDNNEAIFAISEDLIGNDIAVKPRKNGDKYYYIYLLPNIAEGVDFIMPVNGFLISRKDVPNELQKFYN